MTPERWQRVKSLFERALDQPASACDAFLEEAGESPSIVAEVRKLLAGDAAAGSFLQAAGSTELPAAPLLSPGGMVGGHYRIVSLLGRGGMGEVWLAEQQQPVRRRVALKLIKPGMDTREVVTRFESERQALALMEHPNIAKVFDAGAGAQGQPYFVMEYVSGIPITEYCDKHRMTLRERLELFVHVCEGVQHAHHKAIIHRDLKPSNILVGEVDGKPLPRIIDFGVAKATAQRLTDEPLFTQAGAVVGTPAYMSPEQAGSTVVDVDTRTDVYALGAVLYELLAGAPPLDLRKIAFDEFLRRLREEEPSKPSTKIRTQDAATSSEVARKRRSEPLALVKQIRGDLDSIALKALEKERSRRYGSPSDLAGDIARYLRNEPVLAVPPSTVYRARKFALRHRAALVTAGAFALVLMLAAGFSIRESLRASREAAVAEAINTFLQDDLLAQASATSQSGPGTKPDPDLKVRTALDRAAARIPGKFDRQPEVEAAIRDTIGQTYMDLGLYPEARQQLERALELRRRVLGAENPKTLRTLMRIGKMLMLQGNYPQAQELLSQAVEAQRRVLGPGHPETLDTANRLASAYLGQGKSAQAEALYSRTLEIRRRVLGAEHADTLTSMLGLANVYRYSGKYAQAEALYGQILEVQRRVLGSEHPHILYSMMMLGDTYIHHEKYAQAEALYGQILEIQRRVLGSEHPDTLFSMTELTDIYIHRGKYAQAESLARRSLEALRRVLGAEHYITSFSMDNLASAYTRQGKYAQAEELYSQTLEISRRGLGPENPEIPAFFSHFASMYQRQGKYDLAETYVTQALAVQRHTLGSGHPDTMASVADLALAYLSQGKFAQSEALAREALEFHRKQQPDHWQRFRAESLLGASLAGQKQYPEAEPLLIEGYRGMMERKDRIEGWNHYHLDRAREWLVQLYRAWGKPEKAAEWREG